MLTLLFLKNKKIENIWTTGLKVQKQKAKMILGYLIIKFAWGSINWEEKDKLFYL
jgi:hypothetical protein